MRWVASWRYAAVLYMHTSLASTTLLTSRHLALSLSVLQKHFDTSFLLTTTGHYHCKWPIIEMGRLLSRRCIRVLTLWDCSWHACYGSGSRLQEARVAVPGPVLQRDRGRPRA